MKWGLLATLYRSTNPWCCRRYISRVLELNALHCGPVKEESHRNYCATRAVHPSASFSKAVEFFKTIFLPIKYQDPTVVGRGYIGFSVWEFIKSFLGSTSHVLATQCLLHSAHLTPASSTLPASLNFIVKDGLGCLAIMVAASKLGNQIDIEPKRLRFAGEIVHNVGVGLEIAAPAVVAGLVDGLHNGTSAVSPAAGFLGVASVGNALKGVAGLTNSATRATINKAFAQSENLGDITAKAHSQAMVGHLLGLAAGLVLSYELSGALAGGRLGLPLAAAFAVLAALHIAASYRGLTCLPLTTLTRQRYALLLDGYVLGGLGAVPSPEAVSAREPILSSSSHAPLSPAIHMPCPLHVLLLRSSSLFDPANRMLTLLRFFENERYIAAVAHAAHDGHRKSSLIRKLIYKLKLALRRPAQFRLPENGLDVFVVLQEKASSVDVLKAYFHAHLLKRALMQRIGTNPCVYSPPELDELERTIASTVNRQFPSLLHQMEAAGWNTAEAMLCSKYGHRASWGPHYSTQAD